MTSRGRTPESHRNAEERKVSDMQPTNSSAGRESGPRSVGRVWGTLAVLALVVTWGCENPLNVQNPNKLTEENVNSPGAYAAAVGASRNNLARAANGMLAIMNNVTDQSFWIGSRDAWGALDQGNISDPTNEFTDITWPAVGQARFAADKAIILGEQFQSDGTLPSTALLAEAYLYGGTLYTLIADTWQRYVLPEDPLDADTPGQPIPADQMTSLYDTAIDYLTRGLDIAAAGSETEARLLAMRARARQAKQIRLQIQSGSPTSPGIVSAPQAAADAQAALNLSGVQAQGGLQGWTFELAFQDGLLDITCESWAPMVWSRGELQLGDESGADNDYFALSNSDQTVDGVALTDPIDTGTADPVLVAQLARFRAGGRNASMIEMSARELHLIIAENALANADTGTFATQINAVRTLDGLTAWDENAPQVPAATILEHERNVNLMWQGRRLADHYRFGNQDPLWLPSSVAAESPGTLFPITITEIRSNPNVSG